MAWEKKVTSRLVWGNPPVPPERRRAGVSVPHGII
jgi:hypothetical protein